MINRQQYEAQLQHIFRLLLENKTQEEIARELHISTRTVARYSQRIEKRYGQMQRQKTDSTLFLECNLFKNRLLKMYRILEQKALDPKTSGTETAKCCQVAASIAMDVLKLESEGIKAIKQLNSIMAANENGLNNLRTSTTNKEEEGSANNNNYINENSDNWKF